ncbi:MULTISPECIES: DMT family transporter [Gammaproteobacteria]|uniref:DMT family transporter n=1 Tax=Gammaproteobacteria TaxID=1236 RepID=UPI0018689B5F|nr:MULTISPECIES: SMR family transporter [Gammaproteobacteria]
MAWVYLFTASLFEIVMGISLKLNEGWTKLTASILAIISALISIFLLAQALKTLPLGTTYILWVAIGAIGLCITGVFWFKEPFSLQRLFFISLTVIGVIGLKVVK